MCSQLPGVPRGGKVPKGALVGGSVVPLPDSNFEVSEETVPDPETAVGRGSVSVCATCNQADRVEYIICSSTVEPPNKGHFGGNKFVPC